MNKNLALLKTTFCISLIIASLSSQSQSFGNMLAAGAENAETYFQNYAAPGINAFGNGMANGWYNTAKTHSVLGFNVSISPSFSFIPGSDKSFAFNPNEYQDLQLEGDSDGILPTIAGGDAETGSELVFTGEASYPGVPAITIPGEQRFEVPNGIINLDKVPLAATPAPTYNVGIGLPKGTSLKLRVLPPITAGDFKANILGGGVMHDVKQWIPGISHLPFDLSGFVGVSQLTMKYGIDVLVQSGGGLSSSTFEGEGQAVFKTLATTAQAVVSKKLLFFTPFAAVGFNSVKSTLDVNGDYTYTVGGNTSEIKDPISTEFSGAGGLRTTVGARINIAVITLHASYTLQKYNTLELGIGVSVR